MTAPATERPAVTPEWAERLHRLLAEAGAIGFDADRPKRGPVQELVDAAWILVRYRLGRCDLSDPLPVIRAGVKRALDQLDAEIGDQP